MQKTTVIYHDDMDGQMSAMAIIEHLRREKAYDESKLTLIPWNWGDPYPALPPTGSDCYMVDLSMDEGDYLGKLLDRCSVHWFDHHAEAAREAAKKYGKRFTESYINLKAGYPSACVMCWEELVGDPPAIVHAAGLFDAADDDRALSEKILSRGLGTSLLLADPADFTSPDSEMPEDYLSKFDGPVEGEQAETLGRHVLFTRALDLIGDLEEGAMKGDFFGTPAVFLNRGSLPGRTVRTTGPILTELARHGDVLVTWHWMNDGKIKLGLLTLKDKVDCALLAKKAGGGGHRKAAGAVVSASDLPFNPEELSPCDLTRTL